MAQIHGTGRQAVHLLQHPPVLIEAVAAGASRREAAERFEVSVASAVKWLQRWRDDSSAAAKPRGGSVSPLEEFATEILAVIAEHPDLTLVETLAEARLDLLVVPFAPASRDLFI